MYLLAPATIRMADRAFQISYFWNCKLFLFFTLDCTAFISAKLGKSEIRKIIIPIKFFLYLGFLRLQSFLLARQLPVSCQTSSSMGRVTGSLVGLSKPRPSVFPEAVEGSCWWRPLWRSVYQGFLASTTLW